MRAVLMSGCKSTLRPMSKLTPGGTARAYRNGQIFRTVPVPIGRMEVRTFPPGDYLIVDEATGNAIEIEVSAWEEVTIVQNPTGETGPVASAETPHDVWDTPDGEPSPPVTEPEPVTAEEKPIYPDLPSEFHEPEPDPERVVAQQEARAEQAPTQPDPLHGDLWDLTVADLRHRAHEIGVVQKGSKAELIERIASADPTPEPPEVPDGGFGEPEHSGEATNDEPPAEEQLEDQDGPPVEPIVPADPMIDSETHEIKGGEHHLEPSGGTDEGAKAAADMIKAAKKHGV